MTRLLPVTAIACCLLAGCGKAPGPPAPAAPVQASVRADLPADEAAFVALVHGLKSAQADAKSAAGRDTLRAAAPGAFCDRFRGLTGFAGWSGTIDDVRTSEVNRSIDFTVDLGHNVRLEQVFQTADVLYPAVVPLRVGQTVTFSGAFLHRSDGADCLYYLGPFAVMLTKISSQSVER